MYLNVVLIAILAAGAALCLLLGRRGGANVVGPVTALAGGGLGCACGLAGLLGDGWDLCWAWNVPMGSFHLGMDALSGLFVFIISLVCGLAGVYGHGYLGASGSGGRKNLGASWSCYLLLMGSMLLVVTARNGVLFLVAWEVMSLASFFLVMSEPHREGVLEAGWTYLVATHLGTAFLLALFLLLGRDGSLEFESMGAGAGLAGTAFVLAVVGFGTKAGFLPLHVWLPEAHPAAPSHVSAVMSGVMIKTGIYGLLRVVTMLGDGAAPPAWWGWTLIAIGAASGVVGVLLALAQHELKRLLAYHSVENIGIIALGLGIGLLGLSRGSPTMAVLGLAGGLLHVVNHALFKGLLFLGGGAVIHAVGSGRIDRLGGLLRRMPTTGATFAIASAAICGLPPLNGFVSEFLVFVGAFGAVSARTAPAAGVIAAGSLALIGGLAAACFAKAFGIVFLGEPRTPQAAAAGESTLSMRLPMLALAGLCAALGLLGPLAVRAILPAVQVVAAGWGTALASAASPAAADPLWPVSACGAGVVLLAVGLTLLRRRLLRDRSVAQAGTWDCGYARPSPRMQYTASSFALPVVGMFRMLLRPHTDVRGPDGLFPPAASAHSHTPDVLKERAFASAFRSVAWLAARLRWMQQGRNQLYVLYIALAVLVLLVWKLGVRP